MSGSKTMIMLLMILPILLAPAALLKGETEASPSEPQTATFHVEYVKLTFIEQSKRSLTDQGASIEYIDFGGALEGSPAGSPIIYANKLGPYQPFEILFEMETLSPVDHPLTVTIIVDGKSTWTSSFEPEPSSEYVTADSPVINCDGGTVYVSIQNYNDVTVTYAAQITLIYS
jgi:hypothetical protein